LSVEYPFGVKVGVALAAFASLWGVLEYGHFESLYQRRNRDPYLVAAQFPRFEDFLAATPENAVLGYLTDLEPGAVAADSMFNTAQYVLAPRILRKDAAHDLVLGNFTKPGDFTGMGSEHGLHLERDFGNGVVLFRRNAP
jgi:hypothetical protein